jgi:hypothetical protein
MSPSSPSFLNACLVTENSTGAPPVGVVRKDRNVWRILRFDAPGDQQPREAFRTREEAGVRLLELVLRAQSAAPRRCSRAAIACRIASVCDRS